MIKINVDLADILAFRDGLGPKTQRALEDAAKALALQAHSHILEQVQEKLHSTRDKYIRALQFTQISKDTWAITLDREAMWIEEGKDQGEMLDDLLASPKAKTARDGCVLNPRNKVLTSTGWKKIKDIVPGDLVLTHSGKFREVKRLLVTPGGLGTEYVSFGIVSMDRSKSGGPSKQNSDLTSPRISLTVDHPVLTPSGWKPAGELRHGDLVATPADLTRLCTVCSSPLPINAPRVVQCRNRRCGSVAMVKEGRAFKFTKAERQSNGRKAHEAAKAKGIFNSPDWGCRDVEVLKKMRLASAAAMKTKCSSGNWEPEVFFEKCLQENGVRYERERPIKTDRTFVQFGKERHCTGFIDFYLPDLNLAVELDGVHWHSRPEVQERDAAKDRACARDGVRVLRIPSHKIYRRGRRLAKFLGIWNKNHSGQLGIAWVKIENVKRGVVNRPDHVYSKKYDICLEAEEHSFCCETVFIHNSRYLVVPFQHNKGPTQQTQAQRDLTNTVKAEMKRRKIPYGGLEKDSSGQPKIGKLHSFDILHAPTKTQDGPGQGHGQIGAVRQGPTGIAFLQGIRVYQKRIKDEKGNSSVQKQVMTFRVASSKHKGTGRWVHPGLQAKRFFEEAEKWALEVWETKIVPEILANLKDL